MPRKFRLHHRKNEFRKLRAKKSVNVSTTAADTGLLLPPVSVPLEEVSIPPKIFADAPISTIATLRQRMKIAIVLPEGNLKLCERFVI